MPVEGEKDYPPDFGGPGGAPDFGKNFQSEPVPPRIPRGVNGSGGHSWPSTPIVTVPEVPYEVDFLQLGACDGLIMNIEGLWKSKKKKNAYSGGSWNVKTWKQHLLSAPLSCTRCMISYVVSLTGAAKVLGNHRGFCGSIDTSVGIMAREAFSDHNPDHRETWKCLHAYPNVAWEDPGPEGDGNFLSSGGEYKPAEGTEKPQANTAPAPPSIPAIERTTEESAESRLKAKLELKLKEAEMAGSGGTLDAGALRRFYAKHTAAVAKIEESASRAREEGEERLRERLQLKCDALAAFGLDGTELEARIAAEEEVEKAAVEKERALALLKIAKVWYLSKDGFYKITKPWESKGR